MKKLTLLVATLMVATFTFAQNSGQWSFGAGSDFTSPSPAPQAIKKIKNKIDIFLKSIMSMVLT